MSESSGPMTWEPYRIKPGTVGPAIPGCEVRLADDGEVICRGGNVFLGYLKDQAKTAETLIDGWLHSGDIGVMDDDGYLKIVDRKKELIITSGGKNISPANLEGALKMIPLVGQACAIGDHRKFVAALLVLDAEVAPVVRQGARHRLHDRSRTSPQNPAMIAEVQRGVDEANEQFAQVEQIKKFVLLGEGVAARHRRAHPDVEAQAARHPRPLRRRDRGDVRLGIACAALRPSLAPAHWSWRFPRRRADGPPETTDTARRITGRGSVGSRACWNRRPPSRAGHPRRRSRRLRRRGRTARTGSGQTSRACGPSPSSSSSCTTPSSGRSAAATSGSTSSTSCRAS